MVVLSTSLTTCANATLMRNWLASQGDRRPSKTMGKQTEAISWELPSTTFQQKNWKVFKFDLSQSLLLMAHISILFLDVIKPLTFHQFP